MKNPLVLLVLAFYFLIGSLASAADEVDLTKGLSYPELEVTPRASERLFMEAKEERNNKFANHGAMLVSSLATLIAAFNSQDSPSNTSNKDIVDNNDWATQVGYAVGGGWLLTNVWLMSKYEPYRDGYSSIKGMGKGSKREILSRERMAEEALYAPARLGTKLLWFSTVTNLIAAGYMMGYGNEDVKVYSAIAALASLAPVFFPYRWIDVGNQHKLYKKKIYGPIAGLTLLNAGAGEKPHPGLGLTFTY